MAHEHAVERAGVEARRPDTAGRDTLEVVEVQADEEPVTLVVKPASSNRVTGNPPEPCGATPMRYSSQDGR